MNSDQKAQNATGNQVTFTCQALANGTINIGSSIGASGLLTVRTENGFEPLRVGPTSSTGQVTTQLVGVNTSSTSVSSNVVSGGTNSMNLSLIPTVKEKCRNFLANLIDLSTRGSIPVEGQLRNLIQELVNANVEPEEFCAQLGHLLSSRPQPYLVTFLKKSVPILRHSLFMKELTIEGIKPPPQHVVGIGQNQMVTFGLATQQPLAETATIAGRAGSGLVHKANSVEKTGALLKDSHAQRPVSSTTVVGKSLFKDSKVDLMKTSGTGSVQPFMFSSSLMYGDNDINDVAVMAGIDLDEEVQHMMGWSETTETQIRSCKDEVFLNLTILRARIREKMEEYGLEEQEKEVAILMSLACEERFRDIIEALIVEADRRHDEDDLDTLFETTGIEDPENVEMDMEMDVSMSLQPVGSRKSVKFNGNGTSSAPFRPRIKHISLQDVLLWMEKDPKTRLSELLYKTYLK